MKKHLLILIAVVCTIAVIHANPIEEPFIQEISVSPPWIEILCYGYEDLNGKVSMVV